MVAWGAIAQGVGALAGGLFKGSSSSAKAAAQQYQYNLKLQQQQQQWNEYMYKNRYQMQREDLEKAGINPLFGMGQAPSVTSGTNSVGMADYVGEQNNKFNQMMSLLDFGQNLSAKRAQTKLIERQAQTEEQNTLLRTQQAIREELNNKWLPKEKKAELENKMADTVDKLASSNERYASIKLKNVQTARENAESGVVRRYEKWAKENPKLAKYAEKMDAISGSSRTFMNILKSGGTGLRFLIGRGR